MKKTVVLLLLMVTVFFSSCTIMKADDIVGLDLGNSTTKILKQPSSLTVVAGTQANFTVKAKGIGELKYQWYYKTPDSDSWTAVSNNGDKAEYSLTTQYRHNGNQYYCKVTDESGMTASSKKATLIVSSTVSITAQPSDVTVLAGQEARFVVGAKGAGELKYQWYYKQADNDEWKAVKSNGKEAIYLMTAEERHNGNQYYCIVTDENGSFCTSETASLTVN